MNSERKRNGKENVRKGNCRNKKKPAQIMREITYNSDVISKQTDQGHHDTNNRINWPLADNAKW